MTLPRRKGVKPLASIMSRCGLPGRGHWDWLGGVAGKGGAALSYDRDHVSACRDVIGCPAAAMSAARAFHPDSDLKLDTHLDTELKLCRPTPPRGALPRSGPSGARYSRSPSA